MSDTECVVRLARRTLRTCARGLVVACSVVAGLPLFIVSVLSVALLAGGIGIVPAPMSLLAARRLASRQRRAALEWSGVTIVTPALPAALVGLGLAGVLSGAWVSPDHHLRLLALFVAMVLGGVAGGPRLLKTHAQVAALLLAPTRKEMATQVGRLSESRSQVADASAAELGRIERDLLRALVLSLPLPVDLHVELPGRLPDPVDSAACFAIEVLANVVKHSAAGRAWAQVEHSDHRLVAIIGDNGTGGAGPRAGSGLRGIEQRLAAFDGVIAVTSPVGGPTVVTMELPCALSLART